MRKIHASEVTSAVARLCLEANTNLRDDVKEALRAALTKEESPVGRHVLKQIVENYAIAEEQKMAICQDTGIVTVLIRLGSGVEVMGDLEQVVNRGVTQAYSGGGLRTSIVSPPIFERKNTGDNTPALLHVELGGDDESVEITVMPKGGGSENASRLEMLPVSAGLDGVEGFVLETAAQAAKACPPIIMGVGIGGSFDTVGWLARGALRRRLDDSNSDPRLAEFEARLLDGVNSLGIGPGGLGGRNTALGVKVATAPTHMACLPVAVCVSCHALREATVVL